MCHYYQSPLHSGFCITLTCMVIGAVVLFLGGSVGMGSVFALVPKSATGHALRIIVVIVCFLFMFSACFYCPFAMARVRHDWQEAARKAEQTDLEHAGEPLL